MPKLTPEQQQVHSAILLFETQLLTLLRPVYEELEEGDTIATIDDYDMEGDWIYGLATAKSNSKVHFSLEGDNLAFVGHEPLLEQVSGVVEGRITRLDKVRTTPDSITGVAIVKGKEIPFNTKRIDK